jgi:large conductance mechanosensitive channel
MGMVSEFREFAMKGNVVDLAVGVVIGGAFGKIVDALVAKIIMPPVGLLIGGVDFSKIAITLKEAGVDAAGKEVPAVVLGIGDFLNALVQFVILAFAIFLVVKAINRMRRPEAAPAPAAPPEDVLLLREIRDLMKR